MLDWATQCANAIRAYDQWKSGDMSDANNTSQSNRSNEASAKDVPQPIVLPFEERFVAILKLLLDHAGISDDAVVKHLEGWAKRAGVLKPVTLPEYEQVSVRALVASL